MFELIHKGGPIMWPIIFCSVLSLSIVLERFFNLYRAKIDTDGFIKKITAALKRREMEKAILICDKTYGPIARVFKAGISKHNKSRQEIKEAIEDAGLQEVPLLERRLSILATTGHISPLLGLLGTVTGMVKAFQAIQEKAAVSMVVNPADLAGGIWEALITTVAGLCVAIPTIVFYNYFISFVRDLVFEMEKSATHLVDVLTE